MVGNYASTVLQTATMLDACRIAGVQLPTNPKTLVCCPLPDHCERTGSFHILPSLKGFKCFGCGAHGGMIEFLVAVGVARTNGEALTLLGDLHRIPRDNDSTTPFTQRQYRRPASAAALLPPEKPEPQLSPEDRQKLRRALEGRCSLLTPEGKPGSDYLLSRGIERAAADICRVRFHLDWLGGGAAVFFPIVDGSDHLIAGHARYLDPLADPKSKSFMPIAHGVFATLGALDADVLGIVEAPIDALSLAVCGLPAIALIGCGLKPWLRRRLKFRRVIIATDNDDAGNRAADALRDVLDGLATCERFAFPAGINDTNDYLRSDAAGLARALQAILLGDAPAATEMPSVVALDAYRARCDAQPMATGRSA